MDVVEKIPGVIEFRILESPKGTIRSRLVYETDVDIRIYDLFFTRKGFSARLIEWKKK